MSAKMSPRAFFGLSGPAGQARSGSMSTSIARVLADDLRSRRDHVPPDTINSNHTTPNTNPCSPVNAGGLSPDAHLQCRRACDAFDAGSMGHATSWNPRATDGGAIKVVTTPRSPA